MSKRAMLHYIWRHRLLTQMECKTTTGEMVEIFTTGDADLNDYSFTNVCVKVGGVEFNGTLLVEPDATTPTSEDEVLCIASSGNEFASNHARVIYINNDKRWEDEFTAVCKGQFPCTATIASTDALHTTGYLSRLLIERIEEKAARIAAIHLLGDKRWEETLFRLLVRNFGFGIQGDAFEKWAEVLNLTALNKHRDNLLQVEAVFFGQAGLLETDSIPEYYRVEAERTPYYCELKREYKFLAAKFGLQQVDHNIWRSCGNSFPHTRIARLAKMFHNGTITLSAIAECDTIDDLKRLLQTPLAGYWNNHGHFGGTTMVGKPETISTKHLHLFIINTIVPMLYSYGKHRRDNALCSKAEDFLYALPSEDNGIIRGWSKVGLNVTCAADSQALIQLKKEYCNKGRCIECMFAYRYLKSLRK